MAQHLREEGLDARRQLWQEPCWSLFGVGRPRKGLQKTLTSLQHHFLNEEGAKDSGVGQLLAFRCFQDAEAVAAMLEKLEDDQPKMYEKGSKRGCFVIFLRDFKA